MVKHDSDSFFKTENKIRNNISVDSKTGIESLDAAAVRYERALALVVDLMRDPAKGAAPVRVELVPEEDILENPLMPQTGEFDSALI